MAQRIFRSIVFVAVLSVLLTAFLIVPALYSAYEESMSQELQQETNGIVQAMALLDEDISYLESLRTDSRVTLISPTGQVLFDSMVNPEQMENHAQRPEVVQALQEGQGNSTRTSDTLSEVTLYHAQRTENGCVLRLGTTRRSMLGTLVNVLPLLLAMLLGVGLASLLFARRAARRIVAPINRLNLENPLQNDTYDELAPLLTRMHHQHEQLRQEMHALGNARAELAAIMANMREGMILLDKNETVLSINESAARIFNVSATDAPGQNLLSINRDADLYDLVQRALTGQADSLEISRNARQYELYVSPVMKGSAVRGTVLLIRDITERFAAEESRREFTANVSHELKTPLTSISGFAEIIRDGIAQQQDIRHFAGLICKESARLVALVNDILELSRLDESQHPGAKAPVPLKPLLQELMADFSAAAEKKRITLSLTCRSATLYGDQVLLREMFFNLFDNAIKYTPEGGAVSISVHEDNGQVVCQVTDNGIGIPAEHQSHVFERFYRVDKSHSRQTGGTGLGLAIVKHVAQLHHAQVSLSSAEGKGTTVALTFPIAEESTAE